MNRELLEKPFGTDQIKQREGNFGKTLDYIEGHAVIQRLNDAFDARWSFEILEHEIQKDTDEVIMLGKLTAGDIVKCQFGSSRITRASETGEVISLADDLKAAATDALKKSATLLGVGLSLYNGNNGNDRSHSTSGKGQNRSNGPNGGNGSKGNGNGNGRISSKQFNYIMDLIQEKGMTRSEFNAQCLEAYGSVAEHLSRANASSVIKELLNQ